MKNVCVCYLFLGLLLLSVVSCTHSTALQRALEQAGTHRAALEEVLGHYEHDPLKRKAAEFLIANMPGQYSLEGPFLTRYYELLDSIQSRPGIYPEDIKAFYDSIYDLPQWRNLKRVYDLQAIDPQYLIEHIDAAFEAWHSPWAEDLPFEDFCEYILPYRLGNEQLEPWMRDFRAKYLSLMDSLGFDRADSIYTYIAKKYTGFRYYPPSHVPDCKPLLLEGIRVGSCHSYGSLGIYIFRSLGIPVFREFTPNWTNHAMGHEWTAMRIKGKNYPFLLGDKDAFGEHMKKFVYRLSKVYREYYGYHRPQIADEADAPAVFRSPKVKDVTAEYIPTSRITLEEVFPFEGGKPRYAYLTVYDRHSWKIVAHGERKGSGYVFDDISRDAVYLPVYCVNGNYRPAFHPIKVDSVGVWTPLIADTAHRKNAILTRKFMDLSPKKWAKAMLGGCFVFGKDLRFCQSDTLWVDTLRDYGFQTRVIEGTYRCMKYVPPKRTEGNIGEIEVYDRAGNRVQGRMIGNYAPEHMDSLVSMRRAFDGEVLTYAVSGPTQTDAWLGLDFGRMVEVSQMVYLTRSDDNFIREGELYELYYWDGDWISLGQRTGSRKLQYLTYDNIPENALLLLRNLTKGQEERIFTYEDGRQVWW